MTEEEVAGNFFTAIWDIFYEFLSSGHPSVIHFPIIGILMAFAAGFSALFMAIFLDLFYDKKWLTASYQASMKNYIDRFEFTSFILMILGVAGFIIAGITGFLSAGNIQNAINHELLEYKVRLSIYVFMLSLCPIILKSYFGVVYKKNIFNNISKVVPILYLFPMIPAAIMTAIIAGAGGRYVYGHSILDTFGLSFLLPGEPPA